MSSRIQLALNVSDLDVAVEHYTKMFGVEPHKTRPGYANFQVADPPLKLVLFEHPDHDSPLNHLGVELVDTDAVADAATRFADRGLTTRVSEQEVCCHAGQDKVYVTTPDVPLGMWEFYTITDDDPDPAAGPAGVCCATTGDQVDDATTGDQTGDAGGCCS